MTKILLIGAGFSYNWGGWLANEAFEYLLGSPWLTDDLRSLLWRYKSEGFERALHELQKSGDNLPGSPLHAMEQTIRLMFEDMNRGFSRSGFSLNWINEKGRNSVLEFLTQFDAIFTLNQDLLLEIGYLPQLTQSINHNLSGFELPGMRPFSTSNTDMGTFSPNANQWTGEWRPLQEIASVQRSSMQFQPLYKLHGSSNWKSSEGKNLLIMGGEKTKAIAGSQVLSMYLTEFQRLLSQHRTKVMIIGYGFRDKHINEELNNAASAGNLKAFIIDPNGTDAPALYKGHRRRKSDAFAENPIQMALVGASRRPLSRIFGGDEIERDKVLRFLSHH